MMGSRGEESDFPSWAETTQEQEARRTPRRTREAIWEDALSVNVIQVDHKEKCACTDTGERDSPCQQQFSIGGNVM